MSDPDPQVRRRRHRPWYRRHTVRKRIYAVLWGLVAVILVIFAYQATKAISALRLASTQAGVLQTQIAGGDVAAAQVTLRGLNESTHQARSNTDGPLWDLSSHIPLLGRNFHAVQSVSEVLDDVATNALPPIVAVAEKVNTKTFSPQGGKVDLAALSSIEPSVAKADLALTEAKRKISDIDADSLLTPLGDPVRAAQHKINTAQSAASSGHLASRLLPKMLGGEGSRRYMLLIQNNAEVRSTGGITGAFAIIAANKGKISMGKQGTVLDLKPITKPVLKATKGEQATYTESLFTDLRDVNFTPDFPRTGEITAAMVKEGLDEDVDGVISVDPVALSYLLAGTGPVTLQDGTVLTDANAVSFLLNKVYVDNEDQPARQDDIFASAAREIFDVVKAGTGDPRLVIGGLVQAAAENRLTVWSAHDDEQKQIAPTRLSGRLTSDEGETPHVGIYLNDGASTKMEYYLEYYSTLATTKCLANGTQELTTNTALTSNAPGNAADLYVAGRGGYAPRGVMLINVRVYSPFEGAFTRVLLDGKEQSVSPVRHDGRNVTRISLLIKPGETHVISTTMLTGRGQKGDAIFSTTPGVNPTRNNVVTPSACD